MWPFKQIAYFIREWRSLRVCNTVGEYITYVTEKLKTPEKVAWWVNQTVFYDDKEDPPRWDDIPVILKRKKGNCTELSALTRYGLECLPGYITANLCVYGINERGKPKGHAVCAFTHDGENGFIDGGKVHYFAGSMEWLTMARTVRPGWINIRIRWKTDTGKQAVGLP